jgi:hypothetical protein
LLKARNERAIPLKDGEQTMKTTWIIATVTCAFLYELGDRGCDEPGILHEWYPVR